MADPYLDDILQIADDFQLNKLEELYRHCEPETLQVYNYLLSVIKWKTANPYTKYFTILVPQHGLKTGTFIGVNQYHCNELVMSTLEKSGELLHKAIVSTNRINWHQDWEIFLLSGKFYPIVMKALKSTPFEYALTEYCTLLWTQKEVALDYPTECPDDVYISALKPVHAKTVNQFWSPRHIDSENYLATLIKINGGYGLFVKGSDQLVAWAVFDTMGIVALQTDSNFRNKGYGRVIATYTRKEIAKAGYTPILAVEQGNTPAENMFKKIGFQVAGPCYFIANKQLQDLRKLCKL